MRRVGATEAMHSAHSFSVSFTAVRRLVLFRNQRTLLPMLSVQQSSQRIIPRVFSYKRTAIWNPQGFSTGWRVMVSSCLWPFKVSGLCLAHSKAESCWQSILDNVFLRPPVTVKWRQPEKETTVHANYALENIM